jgi:AraC-like DNA-binding protein
MKKRQFTPLLISTFNLECRPLPQHSHTYYEILYVNKGTGIHFLNNNQFAYKTGDLFLICPEDEHHLEGSKQTQVTLIKFTDQFFSPDYQTLPRARISLNPLGMMRHKLFKEFKLTFPEPCKTILRNTIENIMNCDQPTDIAASPFIYYQILSIFALIKQVITDLDTRLGTSPPGKEELITYIHQHIYSPEKTLIKNVAAHFNIAPSYFSAWFKRNFEISYRDYMNGYRTKLIEIRLATNRIPLRQIAAEFGFTDVSHLSNYFKKKTNLNASDYRKMV